MRTIFKVSMLAAALALSGCNEGATQNASAAEVTLSTQTQKVAYAIGTSIGENVLENIDAIVTQQAEMDKPLDAKLMMAGLEHALAGNSQMTEEQITEVLTAFQQEMQEAMMAQQMKMQQEADSKAEQELTASAEWLVEMAQLDGATVTDSGLVLVQKRAGDGAKPNADDTVEVHYRGTLRDGTQFDSSYDRGQTIQFPLSGVIAGWTEGLQLMEVGSQYDLYIPSELAYGPRGAGQDIPGNAALKFEIELVSIPSASAE
ncbi:MAG: FKBP-type peptidyl-prolyl cis-trans isomerase [Ferrimonas sp.]